MSEGYIQRLFDHVAVYRPQVSQIVPAGASTSPVAMADQRLNDPGFADDFSFGSIEIAGMDEDATTVDLFPLPLVTPRPLSREVPPPAAPEPTEPLLKPGKVKIDQSAPPSALIDEPPDLTIPRVGQVFESDFVKLEAEESPLESSPAVRDTPSRRVDPVESLVASPRPEDEAGIIEVPTTADAGSESDVAGETPFQIFPPDRFPPSRTPERSKSDSADMDLTEPVTDKRPAGPLQVEPAGSRPVTADASLQAVAVYPPPIRPEPLPAFTEAPASAKETPVSVPTKTVVEREVASEPVPTPPQQIRPMTASEASVIGPIEHRPRAVTLFGLRRR